MATTIAEPANPAEGEQRLDMWGLDWGRYVTISDALPDRQGLRTIYLDGRLTLLAKSRQHEWPGRRLGFLVMAVASGCGIACEPAGETTFRRADLGAGIEGDETFHLGENADRLRVPRDIDLSTDPPPDLAIEVEVSHTAGQATAAWGRLGVPEVWRYDATRKTLTFWSRRADGSYAPIDRSAGLPVLGPADVLGQLRLAEELGTARWYMQLNDWVRDVLLPRRGG